MIQFQVLWLFSNISWIWMIIKDSAYPEINFEWVSNTQSLYFEEKLLSKSLYLQTVFLWIFFSQKQCKCRIIMLQDEVALKHIKLLNKHEGTYSQSETHRHKKRLMCILFLTLKRRIVFVCSLIAPLFLFSSFDNVLWLILLNPSNAC